jgi:hypothetical protein
MMACSSQPTRCPERCQGYGGMDKDSDRATISIVSVMLFCIAFFAYGLMFTAGIYNNNATSRIGLAVSLADRGSPYIDDFAALTHDKATLGDHFASDKAPGVSFLALPAVAVAVRIVRLLDPDTQWVRPADEVSPRYATTSPSLRWVMWLATLTTSSLYTALAVVALFRIALLLNVTVQGALFGAIIYGFATPTWGWATTFFSHATCGAFLVFGLWVVILASTPGRQWSKARTVAFGLGAGLLLGSAIVIEYPAVLAALLISAYAVWRSRRLTPDRTVLAVGGAVIGALIAGIPLMVYNNALFGSPFSLSYSYSDFQEMHEGLWSIHWPKPLIAIKILFSGERGLLWLSPILALTPIAWCAMERAGERALMILCLAIFLSFLIVNSGVFDWKGGGSTGPRYIMPSLPFLALPFAWLWEKSRVFMRSTLLGLAILSSIICLAMAGIQVLESPGKNAVVATLLPELAKWNFHNFVLAELGMKRHLWRLALDLYVFLICGGLVTLWIRTTRTTRPILKSLTGSYFRKVDVD